VKYKRGELTKAEYQTAIDAQIAECIKLQEGTSKNCLIANEQKLKVLLYRSYSQ
jgi:5-methyltetrahydropteroyltriglutamate--homocysteine methyltransferase